MLEAMSARDPLTGLANRGRLGQVLQMEWRRCLRTARALSLVMIDIDHFKSYNDSLGHAAGDDCIKSVAQALDATLRRPGDLVARYGGEEFTAILPDTESQGAVTVATRMKEAVESLAIKHPSSSISDWVTISCGVAIATPASHLTPEDLMSTADKMLYRAKEKGRNRVESVLL
jgi:two-component system, chemotaxis family, response regulator WspR